MKNEIDVIVSLHLQLVELQKREDTRPDDCKHLNLEMTDALEEALELLENHIIYYDPT